MQDLEALASPHSWQCASVLCLAAPQSGYRKSANRSGLSNKRLPAAREELPHVRESYCASWSPDLEGKKSTDYIYTYTENLAGSTWLLFITALTKCQRFRLGSGPKSSRRQLRNFRLGILSNTALALPFFFIPSFFLFFFFVRFFFLFLLLFLLFFVYFPCFLLLFIILLFLPLFLHHLLYLIIFLISFLFLFLSCLSSSSSSSSSS